MPVAHRAHHHQAGRHRQGRRLAAIARERPVPVYFIGVGEKLEELETFNAREFAQALLAWPPGL
jgi:signal recognition particle GTPase